jgi:hypothetical protein
MWVASGANWFFGNPSATWNPWMQLIKGGNPEAVPKFYRELSARADITIPSKQTFNYFTETFSLVAA